MTSVLCLGGWGTHPELMREVCDCSKIIDYRSIPSLSDLYHKLQTHNPDSVIGWSLGGQLALRAVAEGKVSPSKLVLIATPYQFVASKDFPSGMAPKLFCSFSRDFERSPVKTLNRFYALCAQTGTGTDKNVIKTLCGHPAPVEGWEYWLQQLGEYVPAWENRTDWPETLLIHGSDDAVVLPEQGGYLVKKIPNARLVTIENGCHAVHLQYAQKVSELITGFLTEGPCSTSNR